MHQMVVLLPFRGTSTDWRNRQTGISWCSIKANAKSCTQGGKSPWPRRGQGPTCWKAALWKRTQHSWWTLKWPAMCSCSKGGRQHPWLCKEECCQQVEGSDPPYAERLKQLGLFCLEKKRRRGGCHQCVEISDGARERESKAEEVRLFSVMSSDGARHNGCKLKNRKPPLNLRRNFYSKNAQTLEQVGRL